MAPEALEGPGYNFPQLPISFAVADVSAVTVDRRDDVAIEGSSAVFPGNFAVQLRQAALAPVARTMARTAAKRVLGTHRYLRLKNALLRAGVRADAPGLHLARYCYGVWLIHMTEADSHGLSDEPKTVCELGPGETIGAGLASLISGADRYVAIDDTWAWDTERNLAIFDALVKLFRQRVPLVQTGRFPAHVLTEDRMEHCLEPGRLRRIRESIVRVNQADSCIRYIVQKSGDPMREHDGSMDMIFSHSVMEHVEELSLAYERMSRWLVSGGLMSHIVDFKCHLSARNWNGHWAYSDPVWKLLFLGMQPLINRVPCSEHVRLVRLHGFDVRTERKGYDHSGVTQSMLARRFRGMSTEDLTTRTVFIQARQPRQKEDGSGAAD